jgi:hypothetical protein
MSMGKARKIKQTRGMRKLFQGAYALEAQQAKKPCDTCALRDPEAFVADPGMGHKLLEVLGGGKSGFFCHIGMPTEVRLDGTAGAYTPPKKPDGSIDTAQLTPCGGFLRWAVPYRFAPRREQYKAVMALQLKMCRRYLAGEEGADFRESCGGRADVFQQALNLSSMLQAEGDE